MGIKDINKLVCWHLQLWTQIYRGSRKPPDNEPFTDIGYSPRSPHRRGVKHYALEAFLKTLLPQLGT